MALITIEQLYTGEKYNVMGAVMADYLKHGRPADYDERTWIELLIVKHAIEAAEKMRKEGDSVSTMIDNEPSSLYVRWDDNDNA